MNAITIRNIIAAMAFALGVIFTSCEKTEEPTPKPLITMNELGYENSKIAYAGSDLHIESEIVSEGKIAYVSIKIHHEGEHEEKSIMTILHEDEWEVDTTYTEFSGLKNATFHKHFEVPVYAEEGHYHFHFEVVDMEGQQTGFEEELEIQLPDDVVAPEITVSNAPGNNQVFNGGDTISISGSVSDDKALGGMYIGLVRADQNLSDAEVDATNTITLLHTHEFDNDKAHNFTASIQVGTMQDNNISPKDIMGDIAWQSDNYYIVVKCKDAFGGNWSFSNQYMIEINY